MQALEEVENLLIAGDPRTALSILSVARSAPNQKDIAHNKDTSSLFTKLKTACSVQLAAHAEISWWEVFGLDRATATVGQIKLQFKRLASLVHPDKAPFKTAADTFRALSRGMQTLLEDMDPSSMEEVERQRKKKARVQHDGKQSPSGTSTNSGGEQEEEDEDEGGKYSWWSEWEATGGTRPNSVEGQANERVCGAAGDRDFLNAASVDALRKIVKERQDALLAPPPPADSENPGRLTPAAPTAQELHAALVRARSVLTSKLGAMEEKCGKDDCVEGGFVR